MALENCCCNFPGTVVMQTSVVLGKHKAKDSKLELLQDSMIDPYGSQDGLDSLPVPPSPGGVAFAVLAFWSLLSS